MMPLLEEPVFGAGEAQYTWGDVVLAAKAWGDRRALAERTRLGFACARYLRRAGQPDVGAEVEAAAESFREERELFEAEAMEAWLDQRGIDVDDWMRYILRSLLRARFADRLDDIRATGPVNKRKVASRLWAEGVCGGDWDRLAWKLAGRAVAHDRRLQEGQAASQTALPGWNPGSGKVAGVPAEVAAARWPVLETLERSFQAFRGQVATPEAVRAQITAHQTDWVQVVVVGAVFPDEAMAREALMCVRDDGEELADVATRARTAVQEGRFALEQIPPAQRLAFLSAQKGDLLGPLNWDGIRVLLLRDKILPSPDDPTTRRRAETAVLETVLGKEIRQRVRWLGAWQPVRGEQAIS